MTTMIMVISFMMTLTAIMMMMVTMMMMTMMMTTMMTMMVAMANLTPVSATAHLSVTILPTGEH